MVWLRVKKWLISMKRKRKRQLKSFPVIESKILVTTMSTLGKPLERLPTMFVKDCGYIPVILTNAAFVIEKNIKTKSLFQTQGNVSKINASLSRLSGPRVTKIKNENVHDIVEAMKAFLIHLPEPLLPESVTDALMSASREGDTIGQYVAVLAKFRNSSPHTFAILHFMMLLLKRISEYSSYNSMDVRKLATVFVLDIIKPLKLEESDEGLFLIERMQRLPYLIMVVENIINRVDIFKIVNMSKVMATAEKEIVNEPTPLNQKKDAQGLFSRSKQHEGLNNHANNGSRGGENVSSTACLKTRAESEPQKGKLYSLKVGKRCATASPGYATDDISKNLGTSDGRSRDSIDWAPFKDETPANPMEVSQEGKNDRSSVPQISGDYCQDGHQVLAGVSVAEGRMSSGTLGNTLSPFRRTLGKKEHDKAAHNISDSKMHKMLSFRMANMSKKKRKIRSGSKTKKRERENSTTDSSFRTSDFTTFKPDEEITPWKEASSNSEDSSVMAKTIRNPRILAYKTTGTPDTQTNNTQVAEANEHIMSPYMIPHAFLANSGFRTISRQKEMTTLSESSDSPSSSLVSFCMNKVLKQTPDVCVQLSSHENTPISKELIRGVKLKGSIGVNTSPYPHLPLAQNTCQEAQRVTEAPTSPIPIPCPGEMKPDLRPAVSSDINPGSTFMVATLIKEFEGAADGQACSLGTETNRADAQSLKVSASDQTNHPSVKLDRPGAHVRFQPNQLRKINSSCLQAQKTDSRLVNVRSRNTFLGDLLLDILLVCITLFCISLVLIFNEYTRA